MHFETHTGVPIVAARPVSHGHIVTFLRRKLFMKGGEVSAWVVSFSHIMVVDDAEDDRVKYVIHILQRRTKQLRYHSWRVAVGPAAKH